MEAGVQRLSSHFTWPEFCDKRQNLHQEFVYNVTMFAAARGLPWSDVTQAALMAKALFPQLDGQCATVPMLSSHCGCQVFHLLHQDTCIQVSLPIRSRPSHTVGLVERHDVQVFVKPQHCPAAWVRPVPHGCLRQAACTLPGRADWSCRGVSHSAAHGDAVTPHTLSTGRGDNASINNLLFFFLIAGLANE